MNCQLVPIVILSMHDEKEKNIHELANNCCGCAPDVSKAFV